MPSVTHLPASADHHVPHRVDVAGEDQRVEQPFGRHFRQRRCGLVEDDQVGTRALGDLADGTTRRPGAAGEDALHEIAGTVAGGQAVAPAHDETAAIFEQAELFDEADRDMAVGADAEGTFRLEPIFCGEEAVFDERADLLDLVQYLLNQNLENATL